MIPRLVHFNESDLLLLRAHLHRSIRRARGQSGNETIPLGRAAANNNKKTNVEDSPTNVIVELKPMPVIIQFFCLPYLAF